MQTASDPSMAVTDAPADPETLESTLPTDESPAQVQDAPEPDSPADPVDQPVEAQVVNLTPDNRDQSQGDLDRLRIAALEEYQRDVLEAEQRVSQAAAEWEEAKKEASARKACYDAAVTKLCETVREKPGATLFNMPKETPAAESTPPQTPTSTATVAEGDDDEAWKGKDIGELTTGGATDKDIEKLRAAGVNTMGDYSALGIKHGTYWNADINGIGDKAKQRIEDAFTAWFMTWDTNRKARADVQTEPQATERDTMDHFDDAPSESEAQTADR
jgi:hypothetical protein